MSSPARPDPADRAAAPRAVDSPGTRPARDETLPDTLPPSNVPVSAALSADGSATLAPTPLAGGPAADFEALVGGRYRLTERLGQGGMGTVWQAEQTEPVRRQVAVKMVNPGMDSRPILARFEAERQTLAMMDHPNIAKVFDAGTTAGGRPYFVMELVRGVPITTYCDDRTLTPRERLALFVPVCRAVQHAHQKGVIHRDLKPSNVLVAEVDGRPVPKVIDFGVAKAVGRPPTDVTLASGAGAVVGTPEYMAPEQAGPDAADVDTRADVYALGVVLYELLTGTTPLTRRRVGEASLWEVLRAVREDDPPPPSARLSAADASPAAAAARGEVPRRLAGQVRGELDWIALKCLEKDRGRRYETAGGLARDVERFLAGEAVLAVPAGGWYRVRKFVRRHRGAVAAALVLALALTAGGLGTSVGLVRAEEERQHAVAAAADADARRGEAVAATAVADAERQKAAASAADADRRRADAVAERGRAEAQRAEAEAQRRTAEETSRLLRLSIERDRAAVDVFRFLLRVRGTDLSTPRRPDEGVVELPRGLVADLMAAWVDRAKDVSPFQRSIICTLVGETYAAAGRFPDAIRLLEAADSSRRTVAAGADDWPLLGCLYTLAYAYASVDRLDDAVRLREEYDRKVRADKLGRTADLYAVNLESLVVLYGYRGRSAAAAAAARRLLAEARLMPAADKYRAVRVAASALVDAGYGDEAEPLLGDCLKFWTQSGGDNWQAAAVRAELGAVHMARGQYLEAATLMRQGYDGMRARAGNDPEAAARCADTADRLTRLYEIVGPEDEADRWRAERRKYRAEQAPLPRPVR